MTKQTQEALKMAIEAMEMAMEADWELNKSHVFNILHSITVCKEALAQPAQDDIIEEQRNTIEALNMCIGGEGSTTTENLTRIGRLEAEIEKLTQPAQEPVAWMDTTYGNLHKVNYGDLIPLYTHPAPSWQGLSDDEIHNFADHNFAFASEHFDEIFKFARAILAKVKEKNT